MPTLHNAVKSGDIELVKSLLTDGADPNLIEGQRMPITPLYYAIKNNNLELVKMLLDHGAEPLFRGYSYLTLAIYQVTVYKQTNEFKAINYQIVVALIDKGADVNRLYNHGTNMGLENSLGLYPSLPLFILLLSKGATPSELDVLLKNVRRQHSINLTKDIIIVVLSICKNTKKPNFHEDKILSDYWDEVKRKIDYLNENPVLGTEQTQRVIKECEFLKKSLMGLTLNGFFKSNVDTSEADVRAELKNVILAA